VIEEAHGVTETEKQLSGEWTICLIRWGLLACVALAAFLDPLRHLALSDLVLLLLAAGLYNLSVTLLLYLRLYFKALPFVTLVADIAAVLALAHLSGGANSPYAFLAVFPILLASLRFGLYAGLFTAGVFSLVSVFQMAIAWETGMESVLLFQLGWHVVLFFLVAIVGGLVGERVVPSTLSLRPAASSEEQILPEQLKLVYAMASSLSATLNYERVMDAILDVSRLGFGELGMRVGESVGLVLLYDPDSRLAPASYRNLVTREDEVRRIKGKKGIVAEAIASGRAVIGGAPAGDPELRIFDSLKSSKSLICVPLRAGFETYGVVLFSTVRRNAYTAKHVELLTLYCNQATIALQNASLYQSLREERDKIVGKEEEARHKLARELHDGPTQDVAAIAMRLNFARLLLDRDPKRARAELERLEDLAHRTVKEIRSMLFTLRPIILETEGLVPALNQYAENMLQNDGLPVEIDPERYQDCLDIDDQGVVFAILEEAVNNAKKHAQASRILVRLAVESDLFVAEVIDNGRGFDIDAVTKSYGSRGSLGMVNLRERAELIGGTINIESVPGKGTRVTLVVPIAEEAAQA
jgi:signal transduction histidine kinase